MPFGAMRSLNPELSGELLCLMAMQTPLELPCNNRACEARARNATSSVSAACVSAGGLLGGVSKAAKSACFGMGLGRALPPHPPIAPARRTHHREERQKVSTPGLKSPRLVEYVRSTDPPKKMA